MKRVLTVITLSILLMACAPRPVTLNPEVAQEAAGKIVYVKDLRTDLCFGILSSHSISIVDDTNVMSATNVPCDKVEKYLKN